MGENQARLFLGSPVILLTYLALILLHHPLAAQPIDKFQTQEFNIQKASYLSSSQKQQFEMGLKFFRSGKFEESIELIQDIQGPQRLQGLKNFMLGRNYLRLQRYEEAEQAFKKAIQKGHKVKELYYEYGQVLYALNRLQGAIKAFKISYQKEHMQPVSLYYLGHIHQLLEKYKKSKIYYSKILKHKKADKNLKQIARFQLAESLLSLARERKDDVRRLVKSFILPQFEKAYKIDPESRVAGDIKRREIEVKKQFALDPNTLINGRNIPTRRWDLRFSQTLSYDDNVTFANDLPTTTSTQKGSYISSSKARGSRFWVLGDKRYVVTPELSVKNIHHFDRSNPSVYLNDTYQINPSLEATYEHKFVDKQASLIFDYNYNYIARDRLAQKEHRFFARSHSFSLGERVSFFDFGDTTVSLEKSYYRAYDIQFDRDTTTFSADQMAILPNRHFLLGFINYSQVRAEDETNSSNSFLFRTDYFVPTLLKNYLFGGFFSFMAVDNFDDPSKETSDIIFSYGLNITRRVSKHFKVKIFYDFRDASSDNPSSQYTKHVSGLEFKYKF